MIHCSGPTQVLRVANALYGGREDLFLLVIRPERCEPEVRRWEDLYGSGEQFPHIHGALNLDAVVDAVPFRDRNDGRFELPDAVVNPPLDEVAGPH